MTDFMENYYKTMKVEQGIEINYVPVKSESSVVDMKAKQLRPNLKQKTFEEFLVN